VDPVEILGVALSIAAVWLTTVRNPWCWPVGLASVLAYGWIFVGARLYSDALLQLVFAALEVYGWWQWRTLPQAGPRPAVRPARAPELWVPAGIAVVGALALGGAMARYTDAALPWLDAVLTAASLVAQYWMARLIRANWLLWIAVDLVYVGVYWSRALPLTAALYTGFVVLAAIGWRRWGETAEYMPKTPPSP
jgi:nicotinamide mononucleotide transporter